MRSVRLDDELEARLQQAAKVTGEPVSEIIRQAVREKCDKLLGGGLDPRWADIVGAVDSGGKAGDELRHTGRAFTRLLLEKEQEKAKRRARRSC